MTWRLLIGWIGNDVAVPLTLLTDGQRTIWTVDLLMDGGGGVFLFRLLGAGAGAPTAAGHRRWAGTALLRPGCSGEWRRKNQGPGRAGRSSCWSRVQVLVVAAWSSWCRQGCRSRRLPRRVELQRRRGWREVLRERIDSREWFLVLSMPLRVQQRKNWGERWSE